MNNEGDLKLLHFPQIPCIPFEIEVESVQQAISFINLLSKYDEFQYKNKIKPDYSSAYDLCVFEDGEWITWYDSEGYDIKEFVDKNTIGIGSIGKCIRWM